MPAKGVVEKDADVEEENAKIRSALVGLGDMITSLGSKMDASVSVLGNVGTSIEKALKTMNDAIFESEEMTEEDTRESILDELKRGKITVDEAEERLDDVSSSSDEEDNVPIREKKKGKKGKSKLKDKKGFGGGCANLGDFSPDKICDRIGSIFGEEEEEDEEEE